MEWKNAINAMQKKSKEEQLKILYTKWGEELAAQPQKIPRAEYPRPQMRRTDYHSLNGYWEYAILKKGEYRPGSPLPSQGQIRVPFSPEAVLSGLRPINAQSTRQLLPGQELWYQKRLVMPKAKAPLSRCLLHFGAVDQEARVYLNGRLYMTHQGGYLPFTINMTEELLPSPEDSGVLTCLLQVCVEDASEHGLLSRGKQKLKRGGMFYTAQSGIWQSVWYEWVPKHYVQKRQLNANPDTRKIAFTLRSNLPLTEYRLFVGQPEIFPSEEALIRASADLPLLPDKAAPKSQELTQPKQPSPEQDSLKQALPVTLNANSTPSGKGKEETTLFSLPEALPLKLWTPDTPYLYPVRLLYGQDEIRSYFAMRSVTIEKNETGVPVFCLNHQPLFLNGILDQGYWPDGLMTAPSDEAFVFDITLAKKAGFNMLRKHAKVEDLRFYFHCDRLGMLVWQDMVNGGGEYDMPLVCYLPTLLPVVGRTFRDSHYRLLVRNNPDNRLQWTRECLETVEHLKNFPCIGVWVPFNEGWGQFDAVKITALIRQKDPTRLIDHASGWFDQGAGDFRSVHNYFRKLTVEKDPDRAFVISEYGGFACRIPDHSSLNRSYGYKQFADCASFAQAYRKLMEEQVAPLKGNGLSGAVYTQLSDIEEEVNGLVTYDRKVLKLL